MAYFKRYGQRALSGVQSQPQGGRVAKGALGAVTEYLPIGPPPPPPPPPSRVMAARGRVGPRWYRQMQGLGSLGGASLGTLGADAPTGNTLSVPTLSEPDSATTEFRRSMLASNQALLEAERDRTHKEQIRGFIQIGATLSIPLAAAIWRALGIGRRRKP